MQMRILISFLFIISYKYSLAQSSISTINVSGVDSLKLKIVNDCKDGCKNIDLYIATKDINYFVFGQVKLKEGRDLIIESKTLGIVSQILKDINERIDSILKVSPSEMQDITNTPPHKLESFINKYVFMTSGEWKIVFKIAEISQLADKYYANILNSQNSFELNQNVKIITETGSYPNLKTITFIDSLNGYIGGEKGLILQTKNGGNSWIRINSNIEAEISSMFFLTTSLGFLISNQVLYTSNNSGKTWTKCIINSGNYQPQTFCFVNNHIGFIASVFYTDYNDFSTKIYKTNDAGKTWLEVSTIKDISPTAINFLNDSIGFLSGKGGIIKTSNGGRDWRFIKKENYLGCISSNYFLDENAGFILYSNGESFFSTNNSGETWDEGFSKFNKRNIVFVNDSIGYIVGGNNSDWNNNSLGVTSLILNTINQGRNWNQINTNSLGNLNSIIFPSKLYGIAIGDDGLILKINR